MKDSEKYLERLIAAGIDPEREERHRKELEQPVHEELPRFVSRGSCSFLT